MTSIEHRDNIQSKLAGLKNYVDRLAFTLQGIDLTKSHENVAELENYLLMIQGQKEFVKQAIKNMKAES